MTNTQQSIHSSLTPETIASAVEQSMTGLDSPGFCIACGAEHDGCEPDARDYPCEVCDSPSVYGAEELLMMTA